MASPRREGPFWLTDLVGSSWGQSLCQAVLGSHPSPEASQALDSVQTTAGVQEVGVGGKTARTKVLDVNSGAPVLGSQQNMTTTLVLGQRQFLLSSKL